MISFNIKIADYFLVAMLLTAGMLGLWNNLKQGSASQIKYVTLLVDNEAVEEISTAEDYTYSFSFGPQGEYKGKLEIEEGKVRMLPLERDLCPKGICSHTGWISHSYESIVCLPNRIMVIFSTTPDEEEIDGVTY